MSFLNQINTKPNKLYTFENYFSHHCEITELKNNLINFNQPIILTGSNGSGVTHLLNAICNSFIKKNKNLLFITAQWLIYINKNLKNKEDKEKFFDSLKKYDVIAIDNLQFIYRKTKQQSNFILEIIHQTINENASILLGCSDFKKDFTKKKQIRNDLKLKRIELKQLSSLAIFRLLKHLCSAEDNIPDNLIYAISGYNGSIQQHINCLISLRFNMKSQKLNAKEISIEEFDKQFDLKKYFQKQQLRKCFSQTQLKFTKELELIITNNNKSKIKIG